MTRSPKPVAPPAGGPARESAPAPATFAELMVTALWMELDAVERYRELADAMETHNNRAVAALFRKMTTIEERHARQIMQDMGWTTPPALPAGPLPWPGLESPESPSHDQVHYLMQPLDALKVALASEERAVRFFVALAHVATVPAVKRAARAMAEEEREHVALITAWMAKVPAADDHAPEDPDPPRYLD